MAERLGVKTATPWRKLPKQARETFLYGSDEPIQVTYRNRFGRLRSYQTTFEGVVSNLERRYRETESDAQRQKLEGTCARCPAGPARAPACARVAGRDHRGLNIWELTSRSIRDEVEFIDALQLSDREHGIAERMLKEIRARLQFLLDVGPRLPDPGPRAARRSPAARRSGSGLATQIGSGLIGVLYVLDEPSIGLHQRDNRAADRDACCGCGTSATP